jgi:hypothetical protein
MARPMAGWHFVYVLLFWCTAGPECRAPALTTNVPPPARRAYKGAEVDLLCTCLPPRPAPSRPVQTPRRADRVQDYNWGAGTDPGTLAVKVFFDQFVYTPLWGLPSTILPNKWDELNFDLPAALRELRATWKEIAPVTVVRPPRCPHAFCWPATLLSRCR